jgi:hypothetical protein
MFKKLACDAPCGCACKAAGDLGGGTQGGALVFDGRLFVLFGCMSCAWWGAGLVHAGKQDWWMGRGRAAESSHGSSVNAQVPDHYAASTLLDMRYTEA